MPTLPVDVSQTVVPPVSPNPPVIPKKKSLLLPVLLAVIVLLLGYIAYSKYGKNVTINISNLGLPISGKVSDSAPVVKTELEIAQTETSKNFDIFSGQFTKKPTTSALVSSTNSSGEIVQDTTTQETAEEVITDEWKTYINSEIGYMLKYPLDWSVKEETGYSEVIEKTVKNIVIYSEGQKYNLFFGLKQPTDPFVTSGRTGVGAGNFVTDGEITILGTKTAITKLVLDGKTSEYFFPNTGSYQTADKKHTFTSSFSLNSDKSTGNENIANVSEFKIAKLILSSIQIIPRTGVFCPPTLTAQDNLTLGSFSAFYNETNKYFIRIPSSWKRVYPVNLGEKINPDDSITFEGIGVAEKLQIKSGKDAIIEIPATWENIRNMEATVACEKTMVKYYRRGNLMFIITQINHKGVDYSIMYGHTHVSTELSSAKNAQYQLLLRSFEFAE